MAWPKPDPTTREGRRHHRAATSQIRCLDLGAPLATELLSLDEEEVGEGEGEERKRWEVGRKARLRPF